jgi:hypothetical protein
MVIAAGCGAAVILTTNLVIAATLAADSERIDLSLRRVAQASLLTNQTVCAVTVPEPMRTPLVSGLVLGLPASRLATVVPLCPLCQ